ncbi:MAG: phosphoglycolate phosphatase [Oceanospirillaceae bacterium]|nr:phosphoglycolate phosphatase [Oceanospirillaceae bacterium]MBT12671.1 phosphoglycolate phosphatase [Oceanospirillaceae bacterium]|tara:strand:- start:47980 stop:48633 length:654 start_codon:yes stop_codon:yes gene_type:complete
MSRPAAILFDLDGTLADTAPDFIDVVHSLRAEDHLPPLTDDAIRQQVSNGGFALACLTWDLAADDPQAGPLRQRLLDRYEQLIGRRGRVFPGFEEVLPVLEERGIHWAIVTNKPRLYTDLLLPRINLRCEVVICPEDVEQRKPAPDALFKAAAQLGVAPDHCWYVGDHIRDMEAARAAKMVSIAATFGYIEDSDDPLSWNADHYIGTPQALLSLLTH